MAEEQQYEVAMETASVKWYTPLTRVTPFSKYFALALFVLLPFVGFLLGVNYGTSTDQYGSVEPVKDTTPHDDNVVLDVSTSTIRLQGVVKPGGQNTCQVDGVCSVMVGDTEVVWATGWAQEPVGTYDQDIAVGDRVDVFGKRVSDKEVSLYGDAAFYVRKASNVSDESPYCIVGKEHMPSTCICPAGTKEKYLEYEDHTGIVCASLGEANKDDLVEVGDEITFTGTVALKNEGCAYDSICSYTVGDYEVIWGMGLTPKDELRGTTEDVAVGDSVKVFGKKLDEHTVTLYGSNAYYVTKQSTSPWGAVATSTLIYACPEAWISNEEPCAYESSPDECNMPPREYYIYHDERHELDEFDPDYIATRCDLEIQRAY